MQTLAPVLLKPPVCCPRCLSGASRSFSLLTGFATHEQQPDTACPCLTPCRNRLTPFPPQIGVNEASITAEVAPFGGIKQSGLGREQGT
jgi:hypothetical protein